MISYRDGTVTVHHGDCLDVLREMPDASVHCVVTDPPYGLEFMGKDWDSFGRGEAASNATAGMTRTGYKDGTHRLARPTFLGGLNPRCRTCGRSQRGGSPCTCESPDFTDERGPRLHAYQSWCQQWATECLRVLKAGGHLLAFGGTRTAHRLTCAVEDAGFEIRDSITWLYGSGFPKSLNIGDGRGTALKPASEPIVVARKPLAGTVATNVTTHGTGALNIDACRVGNEQRTNHAGGTSSLQRVSRVEQGYRDTITTSVGTASEVTGRWPTNVVLCHAGSGEVGDLCAGGCVDGCPVTELDAQSGVLTSGANPTRRSAGQAECVPARGADSGGASRFFPVFRYEAKAPTSERPKVDGVAHCTVKPLDLMRWLVRLVSPPGGTVLDPFAGSGTTAEACLIEGFYCITIERDASYLPLIAARLSKPLQPVLFDAF